jgi:hypothetical protein
MRTVTPLAVALLVAPATAYADEPARSVQAPQLEAHADARSSALTRSAPAKQVGAPIDLSSRGGLSRVTDARARAQRTAGAARDVGTSAQAGAVERPAATPRMLTRMNVPHAIGALDSALQQCTVLGGPSPKTTVTVRLSVSPAGVVEQARVTGTALRADVSGCLERVLTDARFRAPGPAGATIVAAVVLAARVPSQPAAAAAAEADAPSSKSSPPEGAQAKQAP